MVEARTPAGRIIRLSVRTDPFALGYRNHLGLGISLHSGTKTLVDRLARLPQVLNIVETSGRYDIIAWTISRDTENLLDLVSEALGDSPGIDSVEMLSTLKVVKSSWEYLQPESNPGYVTPWRDDRELDTLDLSIVNELQADPRQSIAKIAKKLNIHRSIVDRKLKDLEEQNVIRVTSLVNLRSLGYQISGPMLFRVKPSKILTVAEQLSSYWNVRQLTVISGSHQLYGWVVFKDSSELKAFIKNELDNIPEILHCEYLPVLSVVKMSFWIPASISDDR